MADNSTNDAIAMPQWEIFSFLKGSRRASPLTYTVRQVRTVNVVCLRGRLSVNDAKTVDGVLCGPLHSLISSLLDNGRNKVLLDLSDVTHIDSFGIDELFKCSTTVREHGGMMKLIKPPEKLHNLIRLMGLDSVVEIMEEQEALRAFTDQERAIAA